ncbi:carbonic anhydrase 1-like [Drosophila takahashii]|uniref:carbonic anhydrase 1-like n=1 Tax=Drosophila takahashii TaxID=29030 RepID=UPI001CF8E78C|nr:carbonic anhydrase 2-like [Drosophila takahashii]
MRRCRNTPTAIVIAPILICASVVWGQDLLNDYASCSGKHQSPTSSDLINAVDKEFPKLELLNFNTTPRTLQVSNNGHTVLVKMTFDKDKVPTVRGGPLAEEAPLGYQFEQFHFYWGDNNTIGSDDLFYSQASPFELHVVLRNLEYRDFASALDKDNGIAVMAFLFQIGSVSDRGYEGLTNLFAQIDRKGKTANMTNPLPLSEYISNHEEIYISFRGSLAIPPCGEEVTWIYFIYSIYITEKQLNSFRLLTANDDHLKKILQPIQTFNGRTLYKNTEVSKEGYSVPFVNRENAAYLWVIRFIDNDRYKLTSDGDERRYCASGNLEQAPPAQFYIDHHSLLSIGSRSQRSVRPFVGSVKSQLVVRTCGV